MESVLPAGYHARPVVLDDAQAVLDIVHANSLARDGTTESTLQSILEEWADPDLDLTRDTRVVIAPDGRLAGYVGVLGRGREALPFVDLCVPHPDPALCALLAPPLLVWAEAWAWAKAAVVPPGVRMALRITADCREPDYLALLAGCGYDPIRYTFRMGATFTGPPEPGHCPDGLIIRAAEAGDALLAFEAYRDAWRDHFGYVERPYEIALEAWQHRWEAEFTPGLWLLGMDGPDVAGLCLNLAPYAGDESQGYIMLLCVRREYRRRGLAGALLRRSLSELYVRGKHRITLHVDSQSLTGATRLYERAGLSAEVTYALCEKELRPGLDPSTRRPGQP